MDVQQIGHYRLDGLLGAGSMGEVYRAYDSSRGRTVALKLLPEGNATDPDYVARFRRESQVLARLREPHIIPIHDFGELDGRLFIDMRFVDGRSVRELLAEYGSMTPAFVVHVIGQVSDALDAAHADGLVHRDIKPSNVLVTPSGFVYVVDFGIARSLGTAPTVTRGAVGTLDYMAPERFTNTDVDGRTDVYSMTCLLYECLTGSKPFPGEDLPALMYAHLYSEPPRPSTVAEVPAAFDVVVATGMAKSPDDRYPSPGALAEAAWAAVADVAAMPGYVDWQPMAWSEATTGTVATSVVAAMAARKAPPAIAEPTGAPDTANPVPAQAPSPDAVPLPGHPPDVPRLPHGPLPPAAPPRRPVRRGGRRRRLLGVTAAVVVIGALVAVGIIMLRAATPPTTTNPAAEAPSSQVQAVASIAVPTVAGMVSGGTTPGYMSVAPNGRYAYIANQAAGYVTVLDMVINKVTATIPVPAGPPQFVTFSPDGKRAYVSIFNADRSIALIGVLDTRTNTLLSTIPVGKRPYASATNGDGTRLYVPSHDDARLDVIDTANNTVISRVAVPRNPHWVAFSKDGNRIYTANHESNVVTVLDASNNAILTTIPVGKSPHSTEVSPDGGRVSVVNYDSSTVSVIDTATNAVVATVPVGAKPQDIAYAPDGRYMYTANVDGNSVSVIDATTNTVTATIPIADGPTSIGVTPDGKRAYVTALNSGQIYILDIAAS